MPSFERCPKIPRKFFFFLIVLGLIAQAGFIIKQDLPQDRIEPDKGFSYSVRLKTPAYPFLTADSDSLGKPERSRTVLLESNHVLSFPHAPREAIQEEGGGRYRHWKKGMLYFSSSDGSDPRGSSHVYTLQLQLRLHPWVRGAGFVLLILGVLGLFVSLGGGVLIRKLPFARFYLRPASTSVGRHFFTAVFIFSASYLMLNAVLWKQRCERDLTPSPYGTVTQKHRHYLQDKSRYDLIFAGDSRTYTNVHPHLIDRELGGKSFNLSGFTHWFPTQYPHFQELAETQLKTQRVIWSIGHQNFQKSGALQTQYPVGLNNLILYLRNGFKSEELWANLCYFNPLLQVFDRAPQWKTRFETWQKETFIASAAKLPEQKIALNKRVQVQAEEKSLELPEIEKFREAGILASYQYNNDAAGRVNSVALLTKAGSYWLLELDRLYFRQKQVRTSAEQNPAAVNQTLQKPFQADPGYWTLFLKILDLYRDSPELLIVNEMEEAPHIYVTPEKRAWYRRFMRKIVQPEVERRGHVYLRADWDSYQDSDYFDYNHLNSIGSVRYSAELAGLLSKVIRER